MLAFYEAGLNRKNYAEASAALEGMLSPEGTKFQYLTGVHDPVNVDPTSYRLDSLVQALPQQHRIQRALIVDYYGNVRQYPAWHAYLKARQPKTLIIWGKNDPIFLPAGANAYTADLPKAAEQAGILLGENCEVSHSCCLGGVRAAALRGRAGYGRRHRRQPLRARDHPDMPGHGDPLRHGGPTRSGAAAARQGQG